MARHPHLIGAYSKDGVPGGVSTIFTDTGAAGQRRAGAVRADCSSHRYRGTDSWRAGPRTQEPRHSDVADRQHVTLRPGPDGKPQVDVQSRDGVPAVGYAVRNDHGRISVIPHDVASLVPAVLDPALFDVTGLVEMGYDDAHRADLPVIVRESAGARVMASGGFTSTRTLASIGATAGRIEKSRATAFGSALTAARSPRPAKIWLDTALHGDPGPERRPGPTSKTPPSSGSKAAAAPLDGFWSRCRRRPRGAAASTVTA